MIEQCTRLQTTDRTPGDRTPHGQNLSWINFDITVHLYRDREGILYHVNAWWNIYYITIWITFIKDYIKWQLRNIRGVTIRHVSNFTTTASIPGIDPRSPTPLKSSSKWLVLLHQYLPWTIPPPQTPQHPRRLCGGRLAAVTGPSMMLSG